MITVTILSITTLLFIVSTLIISYAFNTAEKERVKLKQELLSLLAINEFYKRITTNSTGYFKHSYIDAHFEVEASVFIPFRVRQIDMTGSKILVDFDFILLKKISSKKGSLIEFDEETTRYLRMKEQQWHNIITPELLWAELFEPKNVSNKFEETNVSNEYESAPKKTKELERIVPTITFTEFEKNDIKAFLKFSVIPEEKKVTIKKILKL